MLLGDSPNHNMNMLTKFQVKRCIYSPTHQNTVSVKWLRATLSHSAYCNIIFDAGSIMKINSPNHLLHSHQVLFCMLCKLWIYWWFSVTTPGKRLFPSSKLGISKILGRYQSLVQKACTPKNGPITLWLIQMHCHQSCIIFHGNCLHKKALNMGQNRKLCVRLLKCPQVCRSKTTITNYQKSLNFRQLEDNNL